VTYEIVGVSREIRTDISTINIRDRNRIDRATCIGEKLRLTVAQYRPEIRQTGGNCMLLEARIEHKVGSTDIHLNPDVRNVCAEQGTVVAINNLIGEWYSAIGKHV